MAESQKSARCEISTRASQRAFFTVSALLFAVSATLTILRCASMSAMGEMPMPGNWMMSMVWLRMPGQTWAGSAASFLGMWVVMMVAMMLPSLTPVLWRYHQSRCSTGETGAGWLTVLTAVGYFLVWTVFGMVVFAIGGVLTTMELQMAALARAVPIMIGGVVVVAGVLQFTEWKAHRLACCREMSECDGGAGPLPSDIGMAWRHGVRLGLHCSYCCAGLTAILLVLGVMDVRAMAVVAGVITVERLAPDGERAAQVAGIIAVGAGLVLIARAAGLV